MAKLRRFLMWVTMFLIVALTIFSIFGAFIGADRAQVFFNTPPLAVYWFALFTALVAGILAFKRLHTALASFCIHAGCVAILIGGLWGSQTGRDLQNHLLGRGIIPNARIMLMNGQEERQVYINTDRSIMEKWHIYTQVDPSDKQKQRIYMDADEKYIRELPFSLTLDEFRMEYYPGKLHIQDGLSRKIWSFPAEPNTVYDLGPPHGPLRIAGVFKNFKIAIEKDAEGKSVSKAYDEPGAGSNPALEVFVGNETRPRYIFERHPGHATPQNPLALHYRTGMIKDYISKVKVLKDGKVVAQKDIEVNHPLYYGGYHFYQTNYGQDPRTGQMYTDLSVVPHTGLTWVYLGYILLCAGTAWRCWFQSIKKTLNTGGPSHGN
ncbi:cytochrome c biogenesis protein ResB [Planctomycetota bacterium]